MFFFLFCLRVFLSFKSNNITLSLISFIFLFYQTLNLLIFSFFFSLIYFSLHNFPSKPNTTLKYIWFERENEKREMDKEFEKREKDEK